MVWSYWMFQFLVTIIGEEREGGGGKRRRVEEGGEGRGRRMNSFKLEMKDVGGRCMLFCGSRNP